MSGASEVRPAMLLVATHGDWAGRSLESVLTVKGYSVLRTQSGRDAVALARRTRPDAVIVDHDLPEVSGVEVCRRLRDDPTFDPATPLVLIADSPVSRDERLAAHAAGAWAVVTHPLDPEVFVSELATFVRARRASAASREAAMIDPVTGFLTPLGLERWAEQLAARALRKHEPLACVVIVPATTPGERVDEQSDSSDIAAALARLTPHLRQSDILGRTAEGRLAVLAPDTDDAGVLKFLDRLRRALGSAAAKPSSKGPAVDFRAGFYALDDFTAGGVAPSELIQRATRAVDHAREGAASAINFKQIPLS